LNVRIAKQASTQLGAQTAGALSMHAYLAAFEFDSRMAQAVAISAAVILKGKVG
jgi:hypothetical protein